LPVAPGRSLCAFPAAAGAGLAPAGLAFDGFVEALVAALAGGGSAGAAEKASVATRMSVRAIIVRP
jgi:hypothetical protein